MMSFRGSFDNLATLRVSKPALAIAIVDSTISTADVHFENIGRELRKYGIFADKFQETARESEQNRQTNMPK
jgi:hypothetical protein